MNVVAYVTAHGFGHAARSCDVLRALLALQPDARVTLVGDLPEDFVRPRLPLDRVALRRGIFDAGVVQRDSIVGDAAATLDAALALAAQRPALIEEETRFLRAAAADLVVADIPAIPLEAAARAGIPCAAAGNFSWNWIYEELSRGDPRWAPAIAMYRQGYAAADLLLRYPFHEEMSAFSRRVDIPVVATPGRQRRAEIAQTAGLPPEARWALLCFGRLNWSDAALDRLATLTDTFFLTVRPLAWSRPNFRAFDAGCFPFPDLVASADVVVTKPGHGILSECIVCDTPMVCADREDFPEARILAPAIRRHTRSAFVPLDAFYRGEIADALAAAIAAPPPEPVPMGGAAIAAARLLELTRSHGRP